MAIEGCSGRFAMMLRLKAREREESSGVAAGDLHISSSPKPMQKMFVCIVYREDIDITVVYLFSNFSFSF